MYYIININCLDACEILIVTILMRNLSAENNFFHSNSIRLSFPLLFFCYYDLLITNSTVFFYSYSCSLEKIQLIA